MVNISNVIKNVSYLFRKENIRIFHLEFFSKHRLYVELNQIREGDIITASKKPVDSHFTLKQSMRVGVKSGSDYNICLPLLCV